MMSWKERANKRRDFRHQKAGPETPKHRKKKGKCRFIVKIKYPKSLHVFRASWLTFGKYKTRKRAEEAIKSRRNDQFYKDCEFKIEDRND